MSVIRFWRALFLTLMMLACAASWLNAQPSAPIVRFSTNDFWLNLHQFLYVLGRAEAKMSDASRRAVADAPADQQAGLTSLSTDDQRIWRDVVTAYANGPSTLDAVFDAGLTDIANALAAAGNSASLAGRGIAPPIQSLLERAAPIYRRAWWPAHQRANDVWLRDTSSLLAIHGTTILAFITRAYGFAWPAAGYPVHVCAYSNWAGAFSTTGNLLIISSFDAGNTGLSALETVFHEAMHQWDDQMAAVLERIAASQGKALPANLSHGMIFFTAGQAVRHAVPGYVPYADANGVWGRGMSAIKTALDGGWLPYLNGQGSRDDAIRKVVAAVKSPITNRR